MHVAVKLSSYMNLHVGVVISQEYGLHVWFDLKVENYACMYS